MKQYRDFIVTAEIRFVKPKILEINVKNRQKIYLKVGDIDVKEINLYAFIVDYKVFAIYDDFRKKIYPLKKISDDQLERCCVEILCAILGSDEYENESFEELFEKAFEADLIPSYYIPPDIV